MPDVKTVGPMPQIGIGTWNRGGDETYRMVFEALAMGYRHIDTAEGYHNEEHVGRAIADSGLSRGDIFLTTKIGPRSLGPGQLRLHALASLDKLRTSQVDLLLIHWPAIKDQFDLSDYMSQLALLQDVGLAKHIGVSNFTKAHIDASLAVLGGRPITTNQCEIHVFMQNRPIVEHCRKKSIAMTAYSPLARGAVAGHPVLESIGAAHGASADQVALAFLMAEGHVIIPSSSNPKRMAANLAAKDIALSAAEVTRLRALDEGRRLVNGDWCPVWDAA